LEQDAGKHQRLIAGWLLAVAAMVLVMVVIGGLTRLTHSGLSIVEWRPLTGWLPPLGDAAWQALFEQYRRFPEYRELNQGMTLAEFKGIFWLEFIHRVWGRLIGLAFLVPFVFFLVRGWIARPMVPRLVLLFVLGGLQGALGWFMVMSGLVDRPDVSQYRLVAHLGLAMVIYAALIWVALSLQAGANPAPPPLRLARWALPLTGLVFLTALSGGFVAGIDAGFAYNTFPLMDGELIPRHLLAGRPFYLSFFEDVTTVQFTHRLLAITTLGCVLAFSRAAWRDPAAPPRARLATAVLAAAALVQFGLGVATLVLIVPVALAAAHQAGALVLFTAALWSAFALRHGAGRPLAASGGGSRRPAGGPSHPAAERSHSG
jgi:cytochrome c oxidase assembly protein subunit 15